VWCVCVCVWGGGCVAGTRRDVTDCTKRSFCLQRWDTNYMEEISTWEANSCSASQEIGPILCNQKVHYRVHNNLPLAHIPSQINPIQRPSYLLISFHLCICIPSRFFPWCLSTKTLCLFVLPPIRATRPAHLTHLHLITIHLQTYRHTVCTVYWPLLYLHNIPVHY
jgi:hypothetical protein